MRSTALPRSRPGFKGHEALHGGQWQPDPLILDDQTLVLRVRDRGLLVVSGCGYAGIVDTVRYVQALTGEDRVAAIIGGFHLNGPMFEPIIEPTIDALAEFSPELLVPAHCTGWRASTGSPASSRTRSRSAPSGRRSSYNRHASKLQVGCVELRW
jgi:7,8-dihydropterin-6-yl-methyl-4-(beta-D-ribofuranosyl)aminobenzene 5'-phosphate synthase